MNENQKAAYIMAMAASALIEAMGMQALNQYRTDRGETIAYDDEAFQKVVDKYELHHNSILTLFHG